ncbi:hypothetical protein GALL_06590 [mine drainage metagenome]|uniref:Uncharacterized protein n=1 Tax=mine drainage metagenome TaxID=410659 RepID=A0A1J5TFT0_9ZZZZ
MDETVKEDLKEIQAQLKTLNSYLRVMLVCIAAVTVTLVSEVVRHW